MDNKKLKKIYKLFAEDKELTHKETMDKQKEKKAYRMGNSAESGKDYTRLPKEKDRALPSPSSPPAYIVYSSSSQSVVAILLLTNILSLFLIVFLFLSRVDKRETKPSPQETQIPQTTQTTNPKANQVLGSQLQAPRQKMVQPPNPEVKKPPPAKKTSGVPREEETGEFRLPEPGPEISPTSSASASAPSPTPWERQKEATNSGTALDTLKRLRSDPERVGP